MQTDKVEVKTLSIPIRIISFILLFSLLCIPQSIKSSLDLFSTVATITAQLLMAFRYRDQWLFYIVADLALMPIWLIEENYIIFAEYLYFFSMAIYGWIKWRPQSVHN